MALRPTLGMVGGVEAPGTFTMVGIAVEAELAAEGTERAGLYGQYFLTFLLKNVNEYPQDL